MSGTYQVMLKITLTLILTLTHTRPPMFDWLQRCNNSHSVIINIIDGYAVRHCRAMSVDKFCGLPLLVFISLEILHKPFLSCSVNLFQH